MTFDSSLGDKESFPGVVRFLTFYDGNLIEKSRASWERNSSSILIFIVMPDKSHEMYFVTTYKVLLDLRGVSRSNEEVWSKKK